MLWTIVVILLALWAFGFATSFTAGGLIHLLLVGAIIIAIIQFFTGRKVA